MAWSERQQRLLREIGLRVFGPPATARSAPAGVMAAERVEAPIETRVEMPVEVGDGAASVLPPPATAQRPPSVAAASAAGLGWAELRAVVAACRACRLCESRKQTVFGVGHEQAHWMVIGEAPGAQEDEQGEPFVGAAGRLLDQMLLALGLARAADGAPAERVFIANTLKCRPPGNRNPQNDEMAQCEPFLLRQIELVRPRIVLAMGRFAVQALLRTSEPIGRLRGRVHRYQGVPLVVTYHPAYLLRNPADKARAWEDLCLAAEVAEGAEGAAAP